MARRFAALLTLTTCLLTCATAAQARPPVSPGKIGFAVAGQQGSAGILCSGFTCQATQLGLTRGETLDLSIRTNRGVPFFLLLGGVNRTCVSLPGINNQWVGGSIVVIGTINLSDRIRCWGGLATLRVPVPANLTVGTAAAMQVLAGNTAGPSLSAPVWIRITR